MAIKVTHYDNADAWNFTNGYAECAWDIARRNIDDDVLRPLHLDTCSYYGGVGSVILGTRHAVQFTAMDWMGVEDD